MKRFFTLTLMLFCFILHGFAFDYTDENGVTWTCGRTTSEYDEETATYKKYASLTGASNYGAEVVVPEKVYDGETAYTVNYLYYTFKDSKVITKVILPKDSVTIETAFSNCYNLAEVVNSQYITKCCMGAFEYTSLTSIDLSNCKYVGGFDSSKKLKTVILKACNTIEQRAFVNCTNLVSLGETASITSIGSEAFNGCESLSSIDLSNCSSWPNYSVFENCKSLKEIKLPSTLTEIPPALFYGCTGLTSFDFTNITKIGSSAFEGTGLTSVVIPASVKDIADNTFKNCNNLKSVDLGNINTIGSSAFEGCNIDSLTIPATISSIGYNAFPEINYITINATKVPSLGSSFGQNVVVLVPEEVLNAYKTADVWKDFAGQIFAIGAKLDYDVKTTAQDNAPGLLQQLDRSNLNNIVSLKVSGTINGYDIMLFRNKMDNLHHLDLSDADIVANPYEYYQGNCTQDSILGENSFSRLDKLISVKLPNSVKQIKEAFLQCQNLTSVTLPENLICLDTNSFDHCIKLKDVEIKSCQQIKDWAFCFCTSLKSIILPNNLKIIGSGSFRESALDSIIIPNSVEEIGNGAFYYCVNLKYASFPPSLKSINSSAFQYCSLDSIALPGLKYIGDWAFSGNQNLKELRVPSTLEKIENGAFSGCNLEKVYAYTVLPISINQNTFSNFSNISLYVPTQSVDNYYLNTQWSQFKEIHEFNEPYKYFYLDKEFTLEDKRFDGTPDIDIKEDGGLKVDGKDNQEAGDVTIKGDGDKGNSGTLITDGNLNAKKMRFDISVSDNKWYFFSFPFDIKLSDTKAPGEYKWKMYDGSIRADQGSGGWVNLPDNEEWLKQGKGYIFQTNKAGTLTLKVTKEKFGQLDANNIMKELDVFPSGNNFDASWNFIGNPQTSYYNVNDLGYEAPITVWNGNSYEAVRPGDDDYTLHPFQAFFVQKPTASSTIEFKAEDRLTKTGSEIRAQETKARRLARGFVPSRMIINLNVSDGSLSDKTRVVFNDKKSRNYEMDCDAAKFMTLTNAPQLYSVEGKGTKFAINERPMGSVQLGFTAKKSGTFTISAVRMDQPMLLKDNVAGITIDLTNGDYEFTSEAGTFNKRFLLTPNSSVTSIADVVKKTGVNILPTEEGIQINGCNGKNVDVYNLNGAQVASSNSDGMLRLSAGIYIVKVNGMSTKVMVK